MKKFEVLDKVKYSYTDYSKELTYNNIGFGGSSVLLPNTNTTVKSIVVKIEEKIITSLDMEDLEPYSYSETLIYIKDYDKAINIEDSNLEKL